MSIIDIFLVFVAGTTLFAAGVGFVFARQSGDWKDYSMIMLQIMLFAIIMSVVFTRNF